MTTSSPRVRRVYRTILASAAVAAALSLVPSALGGSGTAPGALCAGASACPGTTSLPVYNPTHYALEVGTDGTFAIVGASDVQPGPVPVYVKSSALGNTTVSGTAAVANGVTTITFRYTAPANGCETTNVAYGSPGNVTSSAIVSGGNGTAGFGYVDASGNGIPCGSTPPPPAGPATVRSGTDSSGADPAATTFTRTYSGWTVAKSIDRTLQNIPSGGSATFHYTVTVGHDAGTDSNFAVHGTITGTNPNAAPIVGTTAAVTNPACTVQTGAQTLPANGSADFAYTCSFASTPPSSLDVSVSWPGQTLSNGAVLAAGTATGVEQLDWSTPTTVVNGSVDVTDSLAGTLGTVTASGPATIDYALSFPGVPSTCTAYDNTATIANTGGVDRTTAPVSVTVCDGSDLGVAADATASYHRTYGWTIAKSVDHALVERVGGGSDTFAYTVAVSHDAGTDGGWESHGTLVVSNPNDWEAIVATVTAATDNGGTCTVAGGNGVTIPASGSATLAYACTYTAPSSPTGTVVVTAAWDPAAAATPSPSAGDAPGYAFGDPAIVDGSVVVRDSLAGTLGTLDRTSPPASYAYALTFAVPTANCVTHANTASYTTDTTGTTGSASRTVELCGPAATGALTIGFWQNKNGQKIVTGANQTALMAYLRGFAPFQDATAPLGSWITDVIKSASAKGAAMNAMLKAQMLATALDAYFSDSALGGNQIGAPGALGAVTVDLTNVGSSGENVSSSFGGAQRLTVAQLLVYASGRSDAGGITWYGNVKAVQGLAKDVFDAINNELVFAP